MEYLDFELEIGAGDGQNYPLKVLKSPAGEADAVMSFPFDERDLENRLLNLQIALLRSGGTRRRVMTEPERKVQEFGQALFEALLTGNVRDRWFASRARINAKTGLRLKLRCNAPELAVLPWEILYETQLDEYLCLKRETPLVRYLSLPRVIAPLKVAPPLRILAMVTSPAGLDRLDIDKERQRLNEALADLIARGTVELKWLERQNRRALQTELRRGIYHIFHFIGHGGFDADREEGLLALADEQGRRKDLYAADLADLLGNHSELRFVFLNACEGARGGELDVFSSTAATLVRRGVPAVLAMQYEITDDAAIEFARTFYESLADGLPVDSATFEGRIAIKGEIANSLEWGTPVLFMRSPDGVLFDIEAESEADKARRLENERRQQAEATQKEQAQAEQERQQREIAEAERQRQAQAEQERLANERELQAARDEAKRLEVKQRQTKAAEAKRLEDERKEQERVEQERRQREEAAQIEKVRKEREAAEAQRIEQERQEAERRFLADLNSNYPQTRQQAAETLLERRLGGLQAINSTTALDRYYLTCAEYQLFLDDNLKNAENDWDKYRQPDHWTDFTFPKGQGDKLVLGVRAEDAESFCYWLTTQLKSKFRLPTLREAQQFPANYNEIGTWCYDQQNYSLIGLNPKTWQNLQQQIIQLSSVKMPAPRLACDFKLALFRDTELYDLDHDRFRHQSRPYAVNLVGMNGDRDLDNAKHSKFDRGFPFSFALTANFNEKVLKALANHNLAQAQALTKALQNKRNDIYTIRCAYLLNDLIMVAMASNFIEWRKAYRQYVAHYAEYAFNSYEESEKGGGSDFFKEKQIMADLFWWAQIVMAREEGQLPAWEGIRIVRDED